MTEQIQPVTTLAVTIAARSGQRSGTMTAKSVKFSESRGIPNAAPIPKRPAKPWIARAGLFASPGRPRAAMPLLALALLTPPALASDFSHQDFLTGNWGGTRDAWQAQGLDVRLNYTAEPLANVAGGEILGGTYAGNIGLDLHFDLARLIGIPHTRLLVKLSKRDGTSVSQRFVAPSEGGNTFTAQEVFGTENLPLLRLVWVAALSTTHKASSKDPE